MSPLFLPGAVRDPTCRTSSPCGRARARFSISPSQRAETLSPWKHFPEKTETISRVRSSPVRQSRGSNDRACIRNALQFLPRSRVKDSRRQRHARSRARFWFARNKTFGPRDNARSGGTVATPAIPSSRTTRQRLCPGRLRA